MLRTVLYCAAAWAPLLIALAYGLAVGAFQPVACLLGVACLILAQAGILACLLMVPERQVDVIHVGGRRFDLTAHRMR